MTCIQRFVRWMKQLNLFKSISKQSATDLKQQRITTRIYLILLASMTFHCLNLYDYQHQKFMYSNDN